jgi:hypothetical protein
MNIRRLARSFARGTWIYVRAQVLAGAALGLALRLAMRVVALTDDAPGTVFTFGGTMAIMIIVGVMSGFVSLPFFLFRRRMPGTPAVRGLLFGAAIVPLAGAFLIGEAVTIGIPLLNIPLFCSLIVGYGVLFSVVVARLDARATRRAWDRAAARLSPEPAPTAAAPALGSPRGR